MEFTGLTDEQWGQVEALFPKPLRRGRGKPHTPWRGVLNTILWVTHSNGKWCQAPRGVIWASKSAAHRWYKEWEKNGFWNTILETLYNKTDHKLLATEYRSAPASIALIS